MPTIAEIHAAAQVLLEAHLETSKKTMLERSPLDLHLSTMGRNRLRGIISLTRPANPEGRGDG